MDSNRPYRISGGQLALAMILALVMGLATPLLTAIQMAMLMPVIVISGVFMVFLYIYGGRLPAWLFMTVQLASSAMLLNGAFMWMLLAAGTMPAIFCTRSIVSRRPFFDQVCSAIAVYVAGMVAALTIAYLRYGGGMIGRLMDALGSQFDRMPDSFFVPIVEALNSALSGAEFAGFGTMTVARYRSMLTAVLEVARQTYQAALPGALLSGAALSGVLSVTWGSWLLARRGLATNESYQPLCRWFLPHDLTFGLTLIWVVAYVLAQTGYASGDSVYTTAYDLVSLAFYIQALSAIDRFMRRRGAKNGGRHALVMVAAVLGLTVRIVGLAMFIIGALSALFGSHGSIRAARNRDNHKNSD